MLGNQTFHRHCKYLHAVYNIRKTNYECVGKYAPEKFLQQNEYPQIEIFENRQKKYHQFFQIFDFEFKYYHRFQIQRFLERTCFSLGLVCHNHRGLCKDKSY